MQMGAIQPSWELRILVEIQHTGGKQSTRRKYVVDILVDFHACPAQLFYDSLLRRSVDVRKRVCHCTYILVHHCCFFMHEGSYVLTLLFIK